MAAKAPTTPSTRLEALRNYWTTHDALPFDDFVRQHPTTVAKVLIADGSRLEGVCITFADALECGSGADLNGALSSYPPFALSRSGAFSALLGTASIPVNAWQVVTVPVIRPEVKAPFRRITEAEWAAIEVCPTETVADIKAEHDAHMKHQDRRGGESDAHVNLWFEKRMACATVPVGAQCAFNIAAKQFLSINIIGTPSALDYLVRRDVRGGRRDMHVARAICDLIPAFNAGVLPPAGERKPTVAVLVNGDSGSGKTQGALLAPHASNATDDAMTANPALSVYVLSSEFPAVLMECETTPASNVMTAAADDKSPIAALEATLSKHWSTIADSAAKDEVARKVAINLCGGIARCLRLGFITQKCRANVVIVFDEMGAYPQTVRLLIRARQTITTEMCEHLKLCSDSAIGIVIVGTGLGGPIAAGSVLGSYAVVNAVTVGGKASREHFMGRIHAMRGDFAAWTKQLSSETQECSAAAFIARGILTNWRAGALFTEFVGSIIPTRCRPFAVEWLPAANLHSSAGYRDLNGMAALNLDAFRNVMAWAVCASRYPLVVLDVKAQPEHPTVAWVEMQSAGSLDYRSLVVTYGVLVDLAGEERAVTAARQCVHNSFDGTHDTGLFLPHPITERRRFSVSVAARAMWTAQVCQTCSRGSTADEFEMACADTVVLQLHMALAAHKQVMTHYGPQRVSSLQGAPGLVNVPALVADLRLRPPDEMREGSNQNSTKKAAATTPANWIESGELLLVLSAIVSAYGATPKALPRVQYLRLKSKLQPGATADVLSSAAAAVTTEGAIVVAKNADQASAEDVSVFMRLGAQAVLHVGIQAKRYARTRLTQSALNAERAKLTDAQVLNCVDQAFAGLNVYHLPLLMMYSGYVPLAIESSEAVLCVFSSPGADTASGATDDSDDENAGVLWPVTFSHVPEGLLSTAGHPEVDSDAAEERPAKNHRCDRGS